MTGLATQFGVKKETVWGTPVTVDKFFPIDSETLSLDQDYYDGQGLQNGTTFGSSSRTKKTTRHAGGDVSMAIPQKNFGVMLDQMVAGTVTPVQQGATAAYKSTFSVGSSIPTKSATVQVNKRTSQLVDTAFTYPGGVLTGASFSLAVGGVLTGTQTWKPKDETTPTTTPAGAALATAAWAAGDDVWAHQDITLTLNGTPAAAVTGVNWTWTQPYRDDRFFLDGSGTIARPIPNGLATITGTLDAEWYDNTYYALFRSGAFASLVVSAVGPTAIAATYFPSLISTFSAIQIRGTSPQVSGPDLLDQQVPFIVKYDGTNAPWKCEYTDTTSTAW